MQTGDPIRPLLGAATCFLLYRVGLFFLIPVGQFLGGQMIAITVPPLLVAAIASSLAMSMFESRRLDETGLRWVRGSGRNLLTGILLGIVGAMLAVLPAVALGLAHFNPTGTEVSFGAMIFLPILLLCGAMGEEIAFRGFTLQYLMRGYGAWASILGMGALFGALHAGNPGATTLGILNTGLFGVLFGFALLRSHDLWLPIGMHFAWNAALPFLGVGLSGLTIKVTGWELVWQASDLWSGGSYGPEASVITTVVIALLFVLLWKVPVCKGHAWLLDPPVDDAPQSSPLPQS